MPAAFESGFFADGKRAWHGLGTVIEEPHATTARAIELAQLDWQVEKHPILVDSFEGEGFETVDGYYAMRRDSDGATLGVVGNYYQPIQNIDAFDFMDQLLGDAQWYTAGSLEGGRKVWMMAKLDREIVVAGDPILPFIFLSNSFDGKSSVTVAATPVRIVCANTLAMALSGVQRKWTCRHLGRGLEGKVTDARETLRFSEQYFERFAAAGETLAKKKMSAKAFESFLSQLVPLPVDADGQLRSDRTAKNATEMQDAIRAIYKGADDLANHRGTAWAAYNAVVDFGEWERPVRETGVRTADENRFSRSVVETRTDTIENRALAMLLA